LDANKKQGEEKMKKFSLLTVALIAVLALCVGTASAQTASVGYKGMIGNSTGEYGNGIMSMNGLSFRGWMDRIGWEGTLFFGQDDETYKYNYSDYKDVDKYTTWMLDVQAMYAFIENTNSKLYAGVHVGYGQNNHDSKEYNNSDGYGVEISGLDYHYKYETNFWVAGPLIGAQYSFQGIPELSFNWEVSYSFVSDDQDNTENGYKYSTDKDNMDGVVTTVGVNYAF
jgi:hypothetical protein